MNSLIINAVNAVQEEEQLEAMVSVLGEEECQQAARLHTLPAVIARAQVEADGHA